MRFDLTDLRLFLAVVDAGSITRGAAEVGLSLPAASARLRDMESAGEVLLLERGRRGVTPTEAGAALAHHARLVLHQMAAMRGELSAHARGLRASVRLMANTAAITHHLPPRLAPWLAAHDRIDLDLKERQSTQVARALLAGFTDIGILSRAAAPLGLALQPFAVDRLVVVTAADHALAGVRRIGFGDVLGHPFITLAGGALQEHLEGQAARLGGRMLSRVAVRGLDGVCQLAGAGVGIGIVPEIAARQARRATRVAIIRLADDWATRHLCVGLRADATASARSLFAHLAMAG